MTATIMALSIRSMADASPASGIPDLPDPVRLLDGAATVETCRTAVRRALSASHLVEVAFELAVRRQWPLSILEALGVPVDLLECFPGWRGAARTPFVPRRSEFHLAPAGAGVPMGTLRLQLSPTPGTIPHALHLLRDLLRSLDPGTRFIVVVEPGANIGALGHLVDRFAAGASSRVRFVTMRTSTVFAQDNARAARDGDGRPVLLVPRAFRAADARAEDELDPALAEQTFGVPVRRSRLYWEGGNVVHSSDRCFVGVDTLAENRARLGLTCAELLPLFEAEFGVPVSPLGQLETAAYDAVAERLLSSGQASFHIDLDVSLLGTFGRARAPRALLADAARGLDFVDDVLSVRSLVNGHFLPAREIRTHLRAEYEAYAAVRHPMLLEYAETLAANGYRVIGVPDLRFEPKMDVFRRVNFDFGYCNVLPGLERGRPAVFHFVSGVRRLDQDAAKRMRLAGVMPVPVSTAEVASALMLLHGGLHCCCSSM
jgi:hypothetical protein